jgi:hypothetical protein
MRRQVLVTLLAVFVAAVLLVVVQRGRLAIEAPASRELLLRLTPSCYPATLSDQYRGDVGHFEHRAKTLAALRPDNRQAFLALANAQMFTTAGIGAAGQLSRHVAAFRSLLGDPGCDAAFKELVAIGSTPGRLYGLAGTYVTDPAFFRQAIVRYRQSAVPVVFLDGCNYGLKTVGEMIRLIENGDLPRSFQAEEKRARSNGHF